MSGRHKGQKAPPPGSYLGTVDGHNALLVVGLEGVHAHWLKPNGRDETSNSRDTFHAWFQSMDAWDVTDGRFVPTINGRGRRQVRFRLASHKRAMMAA